MLTHNNVSLTFHSSFPSYGYGSTGGYGAEYGAGQPYGEFPAGQTYGAYGAPQYGMDAQYGRVPDTTASFNTYGAEYVPQSVNQGYTSYYGNDGLAPAPAVQDPTKAYGSELPSYGLDFSANGDSQTAPLDLQMDSAGIDQLQVDSNQTQSDSISPPTSESAYQQPVSNESVSRLSQQFSNTSIGSPSSSGTDKPKKWADPIAKSKPKQADVVSSTATVDPKSIDTSSANVSDVRKMWQQAAQNAPPPMPKTKLGILLPATEAVSTVHTVGMVDRSSFASVHSRVNWKKPPSSGGTGKLDDSKDDKHDASHNFSVDESHDGHEHPSVSSTQQQQQQQQQQAQKPVMQSPQILDFSSDQFKELMNQIETGDADQKAYAAMELQTMALDSRSQVLMAQNGAIGPLVKLLQPGDPMVQASAAGALWNLAANEQNKFAIAQAGAIQPLVAMLYSDVREAQLSAAGALQNLCVNAANKKTVAAAGGIEALMMLLSDKDRHVKAKAAGALQSLAVDEENQKKIKSLGAIPLITKLLSSRTAEVQSNAAGALHNLAVNDEDAQEAVAMAGAIPPLVSLMQNGSPDLQAKAAATIWSIAGREDNRKRIMEAGGIPPLIRMIQSNHLDCQSKASGAIRCLTMSSFTRPEFEKSGAIPHLVVLLSSGNQEVTINAAGALENLGCR
ncbi:hypothetical protein GUITHDRAFT_102391 [Guillardia theta CCMP2712]|uniref:U-box domain-containing protein n=1 Tax=Guillardia theta (strain CCMP2712) TaxID=905079 RepID=L1JUD3_GUITC|nr:hypothetical protein GUITHDRAFT_102391 [Guillardia theta CCMP2712]EKX51785.1 hypothetical protein GUITHDRAFT_102391 [Guillardia theta CCMP2712]|eukprot:XP_005838765.1 hypothetical protein GUITHDRAFT_102391 [Guillardia theta CCMP2712]